MTYKYLTWKYTAYTPKMPMLEKLVVKSLPADELNNVALFANIDNSIITYTKGKNNVHQTVITPHGKLLQIAQDSSYCTTTNMPRMLKYALFKYSPIVSSTSSTLTFKPLGAPRSHQLSLENLQKITFCTIYNTIILKSALESRLNFPDSLAGCPMTYEAGLDELNDDEYSFDARGAMDPSDLLDILVQSFQTGSTQYKQLNSLNFPNLLSDIRRYSFDITSSIDSLLRSRTQGKKLPLWLRADPKISIDSSTSILLRICKRVLILQNALETLERDIQNLLPEFTTLIKFISMPNVKVSRYQLIERVLIVRLTDMSIAYKNILPLVTSERKKLTELLDDLTVKNYHKNKFWFKYILEVKKELRKEVKDDGINKICNAVQQPSPLP